MATGNYQYQHAVGLFSSHRDAEIALHQLRDAGFNMDKISVVSRTEGGNGSHGDPNADKSDQIAGGAGDMRNAQSVLSNYGIRDWNIYGSAGAQTAAGMPRSF